MTLMSNYEKAYSPLKIDYLGHTIQYKPREGNKILKAKFRVLPKAADALGYNIIIERLQHDYDAQEEEVIIDWIVDRIKYDNYFTGKTAYQYSMENDHWEVYIESKQGE